MSRDFHAIRRTVPGPLFAFCLAVYRSKEANASVTALPIVLLLLLLAPSLKNVGHQQARTISGSQNGHHTPAHHPEVGSRGLAGFAAGAVFGALKHALPRALHRVPVEWADEVYAASRAPWMNEAEAALRRDPTRLTRNTPQLGEALAELQQRHPNVSVWGTLDSSPNDVLLAQTAIPIAYKELLRFVDRPNAGLDAMLANKVHSFGEYLDLKRSLADLRDADIERLSEQLSVGLAERGLAHMSVRSMFDKTWPSALPSDLNERFAGNLRRLIERAYARSGIRTPEGEGVSFDVVHSGVTWNQQPWHKDYGLALLNFGHPGTLFDPQGLNRIESIAGLDDVEQALPWTLTIVRPRTQHAAPASQTARRVMVVSFEGRPGVHFRDFRRR